MTKSTKKGLAIGAIVLGAVAGLVALFWPRGAAAAASPGGSRMSLTEIQALIRRIASAAGIPVWFALAVAELESGFQPRIKGDNRRSYGLMQIFWPVHRATLEAQGVREPEELFDPELNVTFWCRHVAAVFALSQHVSAEDGVEAWGQVRLRLAGLSDDDGVSADEEARLARYRPVAEKWKARG